MAEKKRGLSQFLKAQAPARGTGAADTPVAEETHDAEAAATSSVTARRTRRGVGKATVKRRVTKEGKEQLLVYLHSEGIKQLKLATIEEEYSSVSAVVAEAVNEWLRKHGRPPVA